MNQTPGIQPALYDRKSAAKRLGIGITTLDDLIARNRMPSVRIGARVLVPVDFVERLARGEVGIGTPNECQQTGHSEG